MSETQAQALTATMLLWTQEARGSEASHELGPSEHPVIFQFTVPFWTLG